MNYLYHMVPKNMKGHYLFPLNKLKKIYPNEYNYHIKKYADRKHLLKMKVPHLNCLWNDCIHLTAVHPSKIIEALKKAGYSRKIRIKWFKINPSFLDSSKIIVYLYRKRNKNKTASAGVREMEGDYIKYYSRQLKSYNKIKKETIIYYREKYKCKEKPMLFMYIPHILYQRAIDTRKVEVIKY